MRRWTRSLSRTEWLRLSGFGGAVLLLHVLGWGLFAYYSASNPALAGLGVLAYTFGLRHAFDADHIAAIDNTTRAFLQRGKRPLGTGFFFSLGHSSVVFALATGLAVAAASRPLPRDHLAAAALRGRHVADGHRGRRVHGARLRLGVREPGTQGLLQPHRHDAVGHRRAWHRPHRAPAGHRAQHLARLQ